MCTVLTGCFGPMKPDRLQPADLKWSDIETSDPVHSEDYRVHQEIQAEILKPQGQELLYKDAPITVDETLLAVLTLALTEKLNGKTFERILKLIALLLPVPNLFPSSTFTFFNSLEIEDSSLEIYYYCSVCYRHRANATDLCNDCEGVKQICRLFYLFSYQSAVV